MVGTEIADRTTFRPQTATGPMTKLSTPVSLALVLLAAGLVLLGLARWGSAAPADRAILVPLTGTVEEVADTTSAKAAAGQKSFLVTVKPADGPALPLAIVNQPIAAETVLPLKGRVVTAHHHHGVLYELTSDGATPVAYDATVRAMRGGDGTALCWAGIAALAASAGLLLFAFATRRRTGPEGPR